ncbi:MAG: cation:proton antiporter, partial [Candidatus Pacearchaeota archaeon]
MQEIVQISLVFFVVLMMSLLMRILKQPLIIGYIISGVLIGLFFHFSEATSSLKIFSQFGIAFLLFSIGLGLNPKVIKEVGKVSLITGIGQIIFTSVIGFFICKILGFSNIASLYISIALTFSSTIIIMKLLSDKDALEKLYGRIAIGFLLVQDLVAVIIIIFISSLGNLSKTGDIFLSILLKGVIVIFLLFFVSKYVFSKLESFFASSQEFLFVFSIVFGLGVASLFEYIGLGIEVGALIAGVVLSSTSFSMDVSSKLKPLKDFFLISFFVLLGISMKIEGIENLFLPVVIFSIFILIGNPLIVIILMGLLGYSKKTSFMAGLTVAQISEFSLILILMGVSKGHLVMEKIGDSLVHIPSLVTLVGLITIAGSTYMIVYSEKIYRFLEKPLSFFEKKKIKEEEVEGKEYEYFLFGENRIGFSI